MEKTFNYFILSYSNCIFKYFIYLSVKATLKYMTILGNYRDFFESRLMKDDSEYSNGVSYWRDKLFSFLIMIILPVSVIAYVPSIYMAFVLDYLTMGIIDTIAFLFLFVIVFYKKLSIKLKKQLLILIVYIMAILLLLYLGPNGPGLLYLMALSVLLIIIYSTNIGYISVLINLILSFSPLLGQYLELYETSIVDNYDSSSIITFALNFFMLNVFVVVGTGVIVDGLQSTIEKERKLRKDLIKESENLKKAKRKAEESDKLKSAFLANISHEIRTPMNGIIGFTELLKSHDLSSEEKREYVSIIKKSSDRMLNIINDLVDISKIQSGQMELNYDIVNIDEIIDDVYLFYKKDTENKNISFVFQKDEKIDNIQFYSDKHKVYQIINNLVNNSIKFTEKGEINFGYELLNNSIMFFVKDTGIGISDEHKEQIFGNFNQVELEFRRNFEGAGLGLSITKAFVEMLDGKIWFKSEISSGSEFFVELPIKNKKQNEENEIL